MEETIKTLGLYLLVEPDEAKKKTDTGIIIPDSAKNTNKELRGTVISVGEAVEGIKEKDRVIFGAYAGTEINSGEKTYLIIMRKDIWGVLQPKNLLAN